MCELVRCSDLLRFGPLLRAISSASDNSNDDTLRLVIFGRIWPLRTRTSEEDLGNILKKTLSLINQEENENAYSCDIVIDSLAIVSITVSKPNATSH